MAKNYKMLSVVGPFPKDRVVSEDDMKAEGADFKFLLRVKAIEETQEAAATDELPPGPLGMGLVGEPPSDETNDETGTHVDETTGERVADMPPSGAVKNPVVAEAKAPNVLPVATKETTPTAKGGTGTKEAPSKPVGVVPGK